MNTIPEKCETAATAPRLTVDTVDALKAAERALSTTIAATANEPGFRPHRYVAQGYFLAEARAVVDATVPVIVEQVGEHLIAAINDIDPIEFALDGQDAGRRIIDLITSLTAATNAPKG